MILSPTEISLARTSILAAADLNDGSTFKTNELRRLLSGSEQMQLLAADIRSDAVSAIIATLLDRGAILGDGIRPGSRDAYCRVVSLDAIGNAPTHPQSKPPQFKREAAE